MGRRGCTNLDPEEEGLEEGLGPRSRSADTCGPDRGSVGAGGPSLSHALEVFSLPP